jgi:hypothetical protein
MPLKRLSSPLIVIIAGVILTIIIVVVPDSNTGARPRQDDDYPARTQTAAALTAEPYPEDGTATATATTNVTGTPTATSATPSATQLTPTDSTESALRPTEPGTPPLPPTATATDVEVPLALEEPTLTATPVRTMVCPPGEPVEIAGQGPPRAAFLLYFGQRVVSGGSVSVNGQFSISLVVGYERPGAYTVTVRIRGTREVLRELTCEVPASPSPTPIKGRPTS